MRGQRTQDVRRRRRQAQDALVEYGPFEGAPDAGDGSGPTDGAMGPADGGDKVKKPKPQGGGNGPSVVRLAAGGGLGVLAGVAYGIGAGSLAALDNAAADGSLEDEQDLAARRTMINTLAVSSGVLAAGAVGVGVTAFIDFDGGAGLGFKVRW